MTYNAPPPHSNIPLIHKLDEFYREIYVVGQQIPKRDHFGIWLKIENLCLDTMELIISAALENKMNKAAILNSARIKIEVLKRIIRNGLELKIVGDKEYLKLEGELQEISKMVNGWIKYLK